MCRADESTGTLSAAEALWWLTCKKGLSQDDAKQALTSLQSTQQISAIRQPDVELGICLNDTDLSTLHLQLVGAAMPPKFGRPLNMHYSWYVFDETCIA